MIKLADVLSEIKPREAFSANGLYQKIRKITELGDIRGSMWIIKGIVAKRDKNFEWYADTIEKDSKEYIACLELFNYVDSISKETLSKHIVFYQSGHYSIIHISQFSYLEHVEVGGNDHIVLHNSSQELFNV